ncbi:MAG: hypothetical protein ABSF25_15690 [Bryobacteraceae bacterium]|jgi:hypothetical protein
MGVNAAPPPTGALQRLRRASSFAFGLGGFSSMAKTRRLVSLGEPGRKPRIKEIVRELHEAGADAFLGRTIEPAQDLFGFVGDHLAASSGGPPASAASRRSSSHTQAGSACASGSWSMSWWSVSLAVPRNPRPKRKTGNERNAPGIAAAKRSVSSRR